MIGSMKCSISSQTSQKSTAATAEPQSLKGGIQNNAESYDPKASDDAVSGICYGTGASSGIQSGSSRECCRCQIWPR